MPRYLSLWTESLGSWMPFGPRGVDPDLHVSIHLFSISTRTSSRTRSYPLFEPPPVRCTRMILIGWVFYGVVR